MTRKQLENHLGKKVTLEFSDGDVISGYLRKTGEADFIHDLNFYIPKNFYFLTNGDLSWKSFVFRVSHIVKMI